LKIGHITILVKDIDEALDFYTQKLGFVKRKDTKVWVDMRWVTVSLKEQPDVELTLVLADTDEKEKAVGKQAGDHVLFTLSTDDFDKDYRFMEERGVNFLMRPEEQAWGIEAVFEDLYGNRIDLVQPSGKMKT
jgi:catechol 2,3-dioxygenase-like lactoylglutathione lyase family enzyme